MDILFLLKPGFTDGARDQEGKRYYCPSCAYLEGVLACCPELREKLDMRSPEYSFIQTHYGVGYRFEPEAKSATPAT